MLVSKYLSSHFLSFQFLLNTFFNTQVLTFQQGETEIRKELNSKMIGVSGTFKVLAAISGILFMGYCVYFDKQRRSDPDFKRKLHERRIQRSLASVKSTASVSMSERDVEVYFMTQIHKGETLITNGDVEAGVEHLINAILVCGQPSKLLQLLQSTLPMDIFTTMLIKMHAYEASQRCLPVLVDDEATSSL